MAGSIDRPLERCANECPKCGKDSCVIDSRSSAFYVRRRRACLGKRCKTRWTTIEVKSNIKTNAANGMHFKSELLRSIMPEIFNGLRAEFQAFVDEKLGVD